MDQVVTDFTRPPSDGLSDASKDAQARIVNGLALRPMDVIVSLNVDGMKATLPTVRDQLLMIYCDAFAMPTSRLGCCHIGAICRPL